MQSELQGSRTIANMESERRAGEAEANSMLSRIQKPTTWALASSWPPQARQRGLASEMRRSRTPRPPRANLGKPDMKSTSRPSHRAAIDAKCRSCVYDPDAPGTWRAQVADCAGVSCPLYAVRPLPRAAAA